MRKLPEILSGISWIRISGNEGITISSLQHDSRNVEPGCLFAALPGTVTDGHRFISEAVARGAQAVLCEILPETLHPHITYIQVESSAIALGTIASNFYDNPSAKLKVIGITGTNGKTTTATLLYELFEQLGHPSGLISTIHNRIHGTVAEATHTTPDNIPLHRLLGQMVDAGCRYGFMEVSSHAIDQHRIAGVTFAGGIFTNLSHDHLDYHRSFDDYIRAKKLFFDRLSPVAFALVNKDDKHGMVMVQNCRSAKYSFALSSMGDFRGKILENTIQGLHMMIDGAEVWLRLPGRFNAYNLLAAYSTARLMGVEKREILAALSQLPPVAGRFNTMVSSENVMAVVDYAHTPDALQKVLETMHELRKGTGNLITVVGAGGNRDAAKRPLLAGIACRFSDRVILTSDNPRFEEPETILREMQKGVPLAFRKHLLVIPDRREAIRTACALALPGDCILVAGKGHETYQEIKGIRYPFDDQAVLREIFGTDPRAKQ